MFGLLFLLFTLVPAIEIFLFIEIGGQIGAMNTFAIVLLTGVAGAALAKTQGMLILFNIQKDLAHGKIPANQFIHGLLVFGGGLLLLTPGFLTDVLGLSMVAPFTRFLYIGFMKQFFKKSIQSGNVNFKFYNFSSKSGFESHDFSQRQDQFQNSHQGQSIDKENIIEADFTKKDD